MFKADGDPVKKSPQAVQTSRAGKHGLCQFGRIKQTFFSTLDFLLIAWHTGDRPSQMGRAQ
ncbi:hypothetical protein WN982_25575 [Paraburkholderia sp. IMGN_8]|uniref:hypothetical protein n=1 Tax=Paraburkholderia sp. IMGN_8 TaxID=3136564 RepID=UPI003101A4E4